jgi:hypothetical protein
VEFKSLPGPRISASRITGPDPCTAISLLLFEEFVPLEYRQQLAEGSTSRRLLPSLFSQPRISWNNGNLHLHSRNALMSLGVASYSNDEYDPGSRMDTPGRSVCEGCPWTITPGRPTAVPSGLDPSKPFHPAACPFSTSLKAKPNIFDNNRISERWRHETTPPTHLPCHKHGALPHLHMTPVSRRCQTRRQQVAATLVVALFITGPSTHPNITQLRHVTNTARRFIRT